MLRMITHKFEEAGLGKAPFQFVQVIQRRYQACPGAPVQPGGSCAYCGEGIVECCVIQDANGKRFEVGNVCVHKTGDRGLVDTVKRAINAARADRKRKRDLDRVETFRGRLEQDQELRAKLSALPHPYKHRADLGETWLSYALWVLSPFGGGMKSRLYVAKFAEQL